MDLYIVTGGSRGLGHAIVEAALQDTHQVLAVSRTPLEERKNLTVLNHSVDDFQNFPALFEKALSRYNLNDFESLLLINNAGIVGPVGFTEHLDPLALKKNIDINLTAPIILSAQFLKWCSGFPGWRVLVNISSGVAERPKATWSAYSAAKGGLKNFSHALADELSPQKKTRILCFNPGVMDTSMQEFIRHQSAETFPEVERFRSFKEKGQLRSPEVVAQHLLDYLKDPSKMQTVDLSIDDLVSR